MERGNVIRRGSGWRVRSIALLFCIGLSVACLLPSASAAPRFSTVGAAASERTSGDLSLLFQKIWRVTEAPAQPAAGSIYAFLPNGTLLETSCVETYRIASWQVPDRKTPDVLSVSEDGEVAYTAKILELTSTKLRLLKTLVRSHETQEVTLAAIDEPFVCPDLPR